MSSQNEDLKAHITPVQFFSLFLSRRHVSDQYHYSIKDCSAVFFINFLSICFFKPMADRSMYRVAYKRQIFYVTLQLVYIVL